MTEKQLVAESAVAGRPLTSAWVQITQEMIDQFGRVTLDVDPMHMDPEWARHNAPFRGTIAYGFLTVSLLTHLFRSAREATAKPDRFDSNLIYLNYGIEKLRLVSPVPSGSRVRGHFTQIDSDQRTGSGHRINRVECRVEIEGQKKPALTAEWLSVGVPPPAQQG